MASTLVAGESGQEGGGGGKRRGREECGGATRAGGGACATHRYISKGDGCSETSGVHHDTPSDYVPVRPP